MTDETEQWRDIEGYENYQVSSLGGIRSCIGGRIRLLKIQNNRGYGSIQLGAGGGTRYLHKFVTEAFLGPCPEGMEVDHIDGDRANNRIDNLRYLTHAENMIARRERTHVCYKGHPCAGNEYWHRGRRTCRTCARITDNKRTHRRAELRALLALSLTVEDLPSIVRKARHGHFKYR